MASWSYALSRILILLAVIADTCVPCCFLSLSSGRDRGAAPSPRRGCRGVVCRRSSSFAPAGGRRRWPALVRSLLDDLGDDPGADGAATLADGEPQALVHGDRLDQLDRHLDVVAGHHHLRALGQVGDAGHVGRPEVELRAVAREERRVTAALLLLQAVDLGLELGVRRDRPGLAEHLAALDLLALGASQQGADVVAGLALVEDLAEHLDAGDDGLLAISGWMPTISTSSPVLTIALLDAAGRDGAAAGDREDVLDRHQERLVEVALGLRDVAVERLRRARGSLLTASSSPSSAFSAEPRMIGVSSPG